MTTHEKESHLFLLNFCMVKIENCWLEMLINVCIAVGLSIIPIVGSMLADKDFCYYLKKLFRK